MSEIDLQELIRKLKEAEEEELGRIRRKIRDDEDSARREAERRKEEEELREMLTRKQELEVKVDEARRKVLLLEVEAAAWEEVARVKNEELRNTESELNRRHETIWRKREEFCDSVDDFLRDCELFARNRDAVPETEAVVEDEEEEEETDEPEAALAAEEDTADEESKRTDPEVERFEECACACATRNPCRHMQRRDELRSNNTENSLFSMLDVEKFKKLSRARARTRT